MPDRIHIRCGNDIEEKLEKAGIAGDFLEFSDPVCQGPIIQPGRDDRYIGTRARFIADEWGYDFDESLSKLMRQEEDLDRLDDYDRIILWFEHDVFDQTILLRLYAVLQLRPHLHDRLFIQSIDCFPGVDRFIGFGQLSVNQLQSLDGGEQPVTAMALEFGRRAWAAYGGGDPLAFRQIVDEAPADLPYLQAATVRFCQEYPWTRDGLSLTERLCLQAIAGGATKAGHVFRDVYINREPQPFMGDIMFKAILDGLAGGEMPAVTPFEDWQDPVALTDFGESLLAGDGDWVATNGIDRWFGGVHLTGKTPAQGHTGLSDGPAGGLGSGPINFALK